MSHLPDDCTTRSFRGLVSGYGAGAIFGAITTNWGDVPMVLRNKPWPALKRTGAVMNQYGISLGTVGLVYSAIDCAAESLRGRKDAWNGVLGGLAAGSALGVRMGNLRVGVGAAAALAAMSFLVDVSGQRLVGEGLFNDGATPPRQIYPYPTNHPPHSLNTDSSN